ncbi:MAG: MBL fold metallo-hydrolase, partial [Syntrophales bacterium LBB04]|nr:MBL fold metallo-hydrolase [Syntrophales bacterium LBB04]
MADVQTYVFGGVNLYGWPLGRLIIIPDCSHSPGHCCVYDPQNKIMLTGDVTVEVNPVDPTGSLNALIRYNTLFKQMAAEGNIETVGDGHRSKSCWQKFLDSFPPGLWDEVAAGDFVVGKDNCIRFFEQFENFHRGQRQAVIETHRRLGTVSVPEIADAVLQRNDTAVNVMKAVHTAMAGFPSPWRCLCAAVVREQGCRRNDREGGIPLFEPPEAIIDDPSVEPLGVPEHAWG